MPQKRELRTFVIITSCDKNCKLVGKLLVNLLHSLTELHLNLNSHLL